MAGPITVFGGTGFIGRHLVAVLLRSGATVRVAVRHRVKTAVDGAKAPEIVQADVVDDKTVGSAITGADAVINLVGILTETPAQTYRAIHVEDAPPSSVGCSAPRRDTSDPPIGARREPDIAGDLGPDQG